MGAKEHEKAFPTHAFISFSMKDREIARSFAERLRQSGVPVWIAPQELAPGTPNWDASIREALGRSFAVVLLASKDSRQSPYVLGELEIAEMNECRILPAWVQGDDWADCAPLKLVASQYIDLRRDEQGHAFEALCRALRDEMQSAMPRRYRESYAVQKRTRGNHVERVINLPAPLPGYVMVDLGWEADEGQAVFLRPASYKCLNAVLDDLYVDCLQKRYPPNTYGADWILQEHLLWGSGKILMVPWDWLTGSHATRQSLAEWLIDTPASALAAGTDARWRICSPSKARPIGLALTDKRVFDAMRGNPKALPSLMHEVLRECRASEVADREYAHRFVIELPHWGPHHAEPRGQTAIVLAQTTAPVPPKLLSYWIDGSS